MILCEYGAYQSRDLIGLVRATKHSRIRCHSFTHQFPQYIVILTVHTTDIPVWDISWEDTSTNSMVLFFMSLKI